MKHEVVSDRVEVTAELSRLTQCLELSLQSANSGAWELDVRTGAFHADKKVAELLGLSKPARDFDDILDLIEGKDRDTFSQSIARCVQRGSREQMVVALLDGQHWLCITCECQLGRTPGEPKLLGVMRDVSAEHRTGTELLLHQQQLEGLVRQLRQSSRTDALTQLGNRVELAEQLKILILRAQSRGDSISVLMIDIDHFKSFNDSFGHAAGDQALKQVAELIARSTRSTDIAARFGGEEFCAVASAGIAIGEILAERIRRAVQDFPWPQRTITVSIGLASQAGWQIDEKSLFKSADDALYRAKAKGRNRVEKA